METRIVYYDECGDDGLADGSSEFFVLSGMCIPADKWRTGFQTIKRKRQDLRDKYGFPVAAEMHTMHFLTDKRPYRDFGWTEDDRRKILSAFFNIIANLDISFTNVIIDKRFVKNRTTYKVLDTALSYSIQRIENTCGGKWNYLIVTDEGRLGAMRKTARRICSYNPVPNMGMPGARNLPNQYMIEDVFDKSSKESYFIQLCDMVSYIVHLYYKCVVNDMDMPSRVARVLTKDNIVTLMDFLKDKEKLNLRASAGQYGLVIYPKK